MTKSMMEVMRNWIDDGCPGTPDRLRDVLHAVAWVSVNGEFLFDEDEQTFRNMMRLVASATNPGLG